MEEKGIQTRKLTEIRIGQKVFESSGISRVKVTQEGEIICLEIPIQSTGVSELIDTFQEKAPAPPVANELVKADSEQGKAMGLTRNEWVKMPNYADPAYIKAKEKHDSDLTMAILLKGMAVKILDEQGNQVDDRQKRIDALRGMGMTADQFSQIVKDIASLTRWAEDERNDFLG